MDSNGETITETTELWRCDPVEVICELVGNPVFEDHLSFSPERIYVDEDGHTRIYDEAWTGDWWWEKQIRSLLGPTE